MDDTTFLANDQITLEKILDIANSFYNLNDIMINKDKSELIFRTDNKLFDDKLVFDIKFGEDKIRIKPTPSYDAIRILGVWFNAYDSKKYVYHQIKREIKQFYERILKKRLITDKILTYLINMVLIPTIEYRSQHVIFTRQECETLFRPINRLVKNKLKFAKTAPNSILYCNLLYNIKNIWDNQTQAKITNFFIQINGQDALKKIMDIRIINIQNNLWISKNPLIDIPFNLPNNLINLPTLKHDFFIQNLTLLNENNISPSFNSTIINNIENKILGIGPTILEIIGENLFFEYHNYLKKHNLMFFNQLTNLSGTHLLTRWHLQQKTFFGSHMGCPSKFHKELEILTTTNNSLELLPRHRTPTAQNMLGTTMSSFNPLGNTQTFFYSKNGPDLIFGKTFKRHRDPSYLLLHYNNHNQVDYIALEKCRGCNLNTEQINNSCCLDTNSFDFYEIKTKKTPNKNLPEIYNSFHDKILYLDDIQYETLIDNYSYYKFFTEYPHTLIPLINPSPITTPFDIINFCFDLSLDRNALYLESRYLQNLNISEFNIYTDGSCRNTGTTDALMMFGANFYDAHHKYISELISSTDYNPSALKAELMAVLIALIVLPKNSNITIYTDSQTIIDHVISKQILSARNFFKISKFGNIFEIISHVIKKMELTVKFTKVIAHSGNTFNEDIDKKIKEAYNNIEQRGLNLRSPYSNIITYIPKWNNIVIEGHLRKFLKLCSNVRNLENFLNQNRNHKLRSQDIHIRFTFDLIKNDLSLIQTNLQDNKYRRRAIQLLIQEIPTIEQVKKCLPTLYNNRNCPYCEDNKEDFNHVFLCDERRVDMERMIESSKCALIDHINSYIEQYNLNINHIKLQHQIFTHSFWFCNLDFDTLTFIDLIKGYIPLTLVHEINSITKNNKHTFHLISLFRKDLFEEIFSYWKDRCDTLVETDLQLGINKKIKKTSRGQTSTSADTIIRPTYPDFPIYKDQQGLRNYLYFGTNILDFMIGGGLTYSQIISF